MRVRLLAEAEDETQAAASWYDDQQPGLGSAFLDVVTQALETIEEHAQRFVKLETLRSSRDIRQFVLRRFPFTIIYEVRIDEAVVLAVAHVRRRPNYWKRRLG